MSARPRPSEMPAHDLAVGAGLVPRVPATPPQRIPGPSAAEVAQRAGMQALVGMVVVAGAFVLHTSALTALLVVAYVCWVMTRFPVVGNRLLDELAHGYTTLVFTQGSFWFSLESWLTWDFSAVWKFTGKGVEPPTPGAVDPPGLYPSPDKPDRWQVWTGAQWSGSHRPAPDPYAR
ncbi:hypothetical protein IEQ44_05645 [Nocardioides sp. Y6]|uniref:DUF2510 domain-containing protein n=1 Tax=Nocardioides malaquae TaxID=2773426 RepID=A0ABR9RRC9_9ACTN|nr:hypothetical protein [Nocardioides malaquae]MBE7324128.1 hypothetical protein [Nocardioides malaquae]